MVSKEEKSEIARINGKKGGRPKGYVAIQAELARQLLVSELDKKLRPIVLKAIEQAEYGSTEARAWLFERGYGKMATPLVTQDEDGKNIPMPIYNGESTKK